MHQVPVEYLLLSPFFNEQINLSKCVISLIKKYNLDIQFKGLWTLVTFHHVKHADFDFHFE